MSDITLENTLEVSDIPENFTDEFLTLYFENKRRSGGGPLVSVQRNGSCAVLVFEESEGKYKSGKCLISNHYLITCHIHVLYKYFTAQAA